MMWIGAAFTLWSSLSNGFPIQLIDPVKSPFYKTVWKDSGEIVQVVPSPKDELPAICFSDYGYLGAPRAIHDLAIERLQTVHLKLLARQIAPHQYEAWTPVGKRIPFSNQELKSIEGCNWIKQGTVLMLFTENLTEVPALDQNALTYSSPGHDFFPCGLSYGDHSSSEGVGKGEKHWIVLGENLSGFVNISFSLSHFGFPVTIEPKIGATATVSGIKLTITALRPHGRVEIISDTSLPNISICAIPRLVDGAPSSYGGSSSGPIPYHRRDPNAPKSFEVASGTPLKYWASLSVQKCSEIPGYFRHVAAEPMN